MHAKSSRVVKRKRKKGKGKDKSSRMTSKAKMYKLYCCSRFHEVQVLHEEQKDDDTQKTFCDSDIEKSTREKKETEAELMTRGEWGMFSLSNLETLVLFGIHADFLQPSAY